MLFVWIYWKLIKTIFTFLKMVIIAPNHCTGSGRINCKLHYYYSLPAEVAEADNYVIFPRNVKSSIQVEALPKLNLHGTPRVVLR